MDNIPLFIVVDLFCGLGGTTTGFTNAKDGIAKVIYCVNHDQDALDTHKANHPDCEHSIEDVRLANIAHIKEVVDKYRKMYPNALFILFGSFPCPHFSKARGGAPKEDEMRTMAKSLYMKWNPKTKKHVRGKSYIQILQPDFIWFENVTEFITWGPLDENGKPINKQMGADFYEWQYNIKKLGYDGQWKQFDAADFGAYTSRNRLFGCFSRNGLPIVWPEATHTKNPKPGSGLLKHNAVKDKLDFSLVGNSIFEKTYVEATLKRFLAGLIKFVAGQNAKAFISKYYSGKPSSKVTSIEEPAGSVTTVDHHSLVQVQSFKPVTDDTKFVSVYYGNGYNTSIDEPAGTITTKDRFTVVEAKRFFIDKQYGKNAQNTSIDSPAGTIVGNDKHRLVEVVSWVYNPSYGGNHASIEYPCPTIVARQDKAPLYLIVCEFGEMAIPVYPEDSETMIRIKHFMVMYKIGDIRMRMFTVNELLTIQGFSKEYKLIGSIKKQKLMIGNSVVPDVITSWIEAYANYFNYINNNKAS